MKFNFFLFFSLIIVLYSIELDFYVKYYYDSEQNNIMKYLNNISPEIDLSFGSKEKKFRTKLDIDDYCIVIPGVEIDEDIQKFDTTESTSFKEIEKLPIVYYEKFYSGIVGQDKITFNDVSNKLKFIVASSYSYSYTITNHAYIGLSLKTNQMGLYGLNMLDQLKTNNVINKQSWYLDFNDYSKGKLVIGKYPHEINDKYKEEDKFTIDFYKGDYSSKYKLEFDEIYYGNNFDKRIVLTTHNVTSFSISTRLIYSTYIYGDIVYKKFFNSKMEDKICFSDKLEPGSEYIYYYCLKNKVNINEMENLNFLLRGKEEMVFTLEPKDLFYEHNEYLYFLVVYKPYNPDDSNRDIEWNIGLPFLKKYILTFNVDDQVIHCYKNIGKENKDASGDEDDNNNSVKYIIIIVVLIVIFICCIGFLVFYIIKIKPRKTKANELGDEGFDYQAKDDNLNGNIEGKIGIGINE